MSEGRYNEKRGMREEKDGEGRGAKIERREKVR